jgi:hypothetical protein
MAVDNNLIFVDGENLVLRYKEILDVVRIPRPDNLYVENYFVRN